eukprot:CAMPEP_0174262836 /NCGR_PEP_ID=MMETSP0439-20130205/15796_1 /TAXON_ID=0 /ORGANISM="Stereomyxa ramosa, Strain Chinc5" /LENGTH=571 /DNA_ID=CAMNT_0015347827 /DNA_START=9 /DNA_END=1721 /DNA_ORIENTATION=+
MEQEEDSGFHLAVGRELNCVTDLVQSLRQATNTGFDSIAIPLVHPRYHRSVKRSEPLTRSDLLLTSYQWGGVVGKISTWLNFESNNKKIRKRAEKAFKEELAWASHLSIPSVILPTPSLSSTNYAHLLSSALVQLSYLQLWLRIPLVAPCLEDEEAETIENDPWEWWNRMRMLCEHSPRLSVALEITADLPSDEILDKWIGEPIRAVIISTEIFLTNKFGYPTLSKKHQAFLRRLFKYRIQVFIKGLSSHKEGISPYLEYIRFMFRKMPRLTDQELFEGPYLDYLQAPLQPLMDNLESQTYETFERDPVKYREYEEAVYKALLQRDEDKTVTLMVVGAGRGPLVRASLRASERAGRALRVYAVEKNDNAVVTLRNMKESHGWTNVTIVDSDMRFWEAPEKADILVSELLGSFGDNELSPECLDGAQKFLNVDGGISIPCAYTSFLSPMSSSRLFNEVRSFGDRKHFETPYVVKFHNVDELAPAKPCFTFVHPNNDEEIDNSRYLKLSWTINKSSTLHGFGGYFDAQLFEDVHLSINPETFSEGMISWFPLFFPLMQPMYIPKGAVIEAHFW